MTRWIAVILCLVLVGCGSDDESSSDGFNLKEEVAQRDDGVDYCDEYNWYGDGECDQFCTDPDPDCGDDQCLDVECCVDLPHPEGCCEGAHCTPPDECPLEADPAVTYVSRDEEECALIDLGCQGGTPFSIPECGCGCIDEPMPPPPSCPGPDEVDYVDGSQDNYSRCMEDDWGCDGQVFDDPACGCGCYIEPSSCPVPGTPGVEYVGGSPDECALINFGCAPDERTFNNECGCGCIGRSGCLDSDDPEVEYVGNSPDECAVILFACEDDQEYFDNACGCGCVGAGNRPDYCESPLLGYVSTSIEECARIDYGCAEGVAFSHPECGCGCYANPPTCVADVDCKPGYCDTPPLPIYDRMGAPEPPTPVCYPTECTDEGQVLCDAIRPVCEGAKIAVARDGCWKCVDPRTCE